MLEVQYRTSGPGKKHVFSLFFGEFRKVKSSPIAAGSLRDYAIRCIKMYDKEMYRIFALFLC